MKIKTDSVSTGWEKKAVFLDRDGILNEEIGDYIMRHEEFVVVDDIIEVLRQLKDHGYYLIVVTNQAGIAKGLYGHELVNQLHAVFQQASGNLIDHFYYAPGHPMRSESLSRKPDSLMFEKGLAKFKLDPSECWMIGDKERDIAPAQKLGMHTIRLLLKPDETAAEYSIDAVRRIPEIILHQ